jgi:hypothetical protein
MRTTLDLPDKLFKKAKLQAVHEGVALKEVVTRALERGLASSAASEDNERKSRAKRLFASLDKARNTKPVGPLNRAKLYDRTVLRGH